MVRRTSKEAFERIRSGGLLPKRRWRVYEYLFDHGPLTAMEVEDAFVRLGRVREGRHVNKRLPELRDQGVVAEVGERKCRVSGENAILWDVTENLPKPLPKNSRLRRLTFEPKTCADCPLVMEDTQDTCWMDRELVVDYLHRHPDCPLSKRDLVLRRRR